MISTFFSNNRIKDTLSFNTTDSTPNFSITKSPGSGVWKYDNEKILSGNSQSYSFLGAGPIYGIQLYSDSFNKVTAINFSGLSISGSVDFSLLKKTYSFSIHTNPGLTAVTMPVSSENVNLFHAYSCDLKTLDVSMLSNLGVNFKVQLNSNLTGITFPNTSRPFSTFDANKCDLKKLVLSGLTELGGSFDVNTNSNLTAITNPVSSQIFSLYNISSCNLLNNLDLSTLSGLGGRLDASSNKFLTGITNPTSSQAFTHYYIYGCGISGILDLTGLSKLGGNFYAYTNSFMTSVALPVSTQTFSDIRIYNCIVLGYVNFWPISGSSSNLINIELQDNNWTAAIVNRVLYDLDQIGWTYGTLQIYGTNAAPDTTSGGYNGTSAVTNLEVKGWDVFTN